MREHFDRVAQTAQWDAHTQLDLVLEFLEDYDLADAFLVYISERAGVGASAIMHGHRLPHGGRTGAGCPGFSAVCSGWGLAVGPAGVEIAACQQCRRFATNLHAVAHIMACAHCTQLAHGFRKSHAEMAGRGGSVGLGAGHDRC